MDVSSRWMKSLSCLRGKSSGWLKPDGHCQLSLRSKLRVHYDFSWITKSSTLLQQVIRIIYHWCISSYTGWETQQSFKHWTWRAGTDKSKLLKYTRSKTRFCHIEDYSNSLPSSWDWRTYQTYFSGNEHHPFYTPTAVWTCLSEWHSDIFEEPYSTFQTSKSCLGATLWRLYYYTIEEKSTLLNNH